MKTYLLQRASQVRKFSDIVETQGQFSCVTEKNDSDGKEMTENINDRSEAEFTSVDDPPTMHKTASNEATIVSEIPNKINEKMSLLHQGKKKKLLQC